MPDNHITDEQWEQVKHLVSREALPHVTFPERIIRAGVNAAIWIQENSSHWRELPPEYGDRHTMSSVINALHRTGALSTVIKEIHALSSGHDTSAENPAEPEPETADTPATEPDRTAEEMPSQATPEEPDAADDSPPQQQAEAEHPKPAATPSGAPASESNQPSLESPAQQASAAPEPSNKQEAAGSDEDTEPTQRHDQPIGPVPGFPDPDLALIRHLEHWVNAHYYEAYVSAYPDKSSHYFYQHFRPVLDLMFHWYVANHPESDEQTPRLIDTKPDYADLEGQDLLDAIINLASWVRDDVAGLYTQIHEILAVATHRQQIPYRQIVSLPTPMPYPPASQFDAQEAAALLRPMPAQPPPAEPTASETTPAPSLRRPARPRPVVQDERTPRQAPTGRRAHATSVSHDDVMRMAVEFAAANDGVLLIPDFAKHLTEGPLSHRSLTQNTTTIRNLMHNPRHHGRFTNDGPSRWRINSTE